MAAAAPVPSKQAIRSKLRALEGMAVAKRPQSANNTLGLTDTDEMIRLQAASVAARLRPKSAEGENVTSKTAARALLTNSSDAVRTLPAVALLPAVRSQQRLSAS